MEIIKLYIKQRKKAIFTFCLFSGIFLIAFYLYELPIKAAIYPIAICAALSILILAIDIAAVRKKHEQLIRINNSPSVSADHLPDIKTQDDEDYQRIIRTLCAEMTAQQTEMNGKYLDMVDYYTIWAHQIKTPIASMRLTIQNEDSELSRQIMEDLQRIEQYVEMVLAFLRLDSATTDYVFRETDLDAVVKECVKKFSGQFIRRRIGLEYEPFNTSVTTDEKWLAFVIEQVLSNSLKYTSSGSIRIYMEPPKTLCIADTGIGISPEDLPRVFEKSYTGCNGRSDKKASGIGLYLCKRICSNLGHEISIDSHPDKGTTVKINLHHHITTIE